MTGSGSFYISGTFNCRRRGSPWATHVTTSDRATTASCWPRSVFGGTQNGELRIALSTKVSSAFGVHFTQDKSSTDKLIVNLVPRVSCCPTPSLAGRWETLRRSLMNYYLPGFFLFTRELYLSIYYISRRILFHYYMHVSVEELLVSIVEWNLFSSLLKKMKMAKNWGTTNYLK